MIRYLILLFALALASGARAQKIEPIPDREHSRFWQIPPEQRMEWMDKSSWTPDLMRQPLAILPETIRAGACFDLYFSADWDMGEGTFELFKLVKNRNKRILRRSFTPNDREKASFTFMLWVTIDEPGKYLIRAYQNAVLMQSRVAERAIFELSFEVLPSAGN